MSDILLGYVVAYTYLIVVMGIAYACFHIVKNNEISRKIIHIATGLGWIILKIFLGASIHSVIITGSFVILTSATCFFRIDFVERKQNSLGTVFYTATMAAGALLTYFIPTYMDSWGIGMICLAFGDGFAGIVGSKYNKKKSGKSVVGSLACFTASLLAVCLVVLSFGIELNVFHCIVICIITTIIEAFTEEYDNIYIPVIVMLYSYTFIYNNNMLLVICGVIIGCVMCFVCIAFKVLSKNASVLLLFLISLVYIFAGRNAIVSLLLVYSTIIIADKIVSYRKKEKNKRKSVRSLRQLCPNCVPAAIMIVLWGNTSKLVFLVAFFAAIAEAIADSMASDVGVFSRKEPVDILTFRKVTPGLSGGITLLGTILSLLVCIYSSFVYMFMYSDYKLNTFAIIAISSFLGVMIDSVVGSKFQVKYKCSSCQCITENTTHCNMSTVFYSGAKWLDNVRVNWISNIVAMLLGVLFYSILGGL